MEVQFLIKLKAFLQAVKILYLKERTTLFFVLIIVLNWFFRKKRPSGDRSLTISSACSNWNPDWHLTAFGKKGQIILWNTKQQSNTYLVKSTTFIELILCLISQWRWWWQTPSPEHVDVHWNLIDVHYLRKAIIITYI